MERLGSLAILETSLGLGLKLSLSLATAALCRVSTQTTASNTLQLYFSAKSSSSSFAAGTESSFKYFIVSRSSDGTVSAETNRLRISIKPESIFFRKKKIVCFFSFLLSKKKWMKVELTV